MREPCRTCCPRVRSTSSCFELLHYLDDADLWRRWATEAPRDCREAHRRLAGHPGLETVVEHVDEEFLLHVLRRR
jgi:hypothetical protein